MYFSRDGKDSKLIRVEKSPIVEKSKRKTPPPSAHSVVPHHTTISGGKGVREREREGEREREREREK